MKGNWNYPLPVRFGAGRIAELPGALRDLGARNPLIVTDRGLATNPMIGAAQASLAKAGLACGVFGEVRSNPTKGDVEAGAAALRQGGHDAVVAWGGGSAMDCGKAVATMAHQETSSLWRFTWGLEPDAGWHEVTGPPVICVPTTAGTGAEMGGGGLITDETTKEKRIVAHPSMTPRLVVADPELTVGLPANLTAWTGIDALVHSLEALCVPDFHPMSDGIAIHGMALVRRYLPRAVADGKDIEARSAMLIASSMGAVAFSKGLGLMHGMSHAIGGVFDTHHGLTNAVVMPYVMQFNRPAIGEKMELLGRYLGLADASFEGVYAWATGLNKAFEVPRTLAGLGVGEDAIAGLVPKVLADGNTPTNPVHVGAQEAADVLRRAIRGEGLPG